jgi:hypothetical protein
VTAGELAVRALAGASSDDLSSGMLAFKSARMHHMLRAASDPRGLSLTQPWASAVEHGAKQVETRSGTLGRYLGIVAIHAAKGCPPDCRELGERLQADGTLPAERALPRGAVVALADLWWRRRTAKGDQQPGQGGAWVLELSALERSLGNYDTAHGERWGLGLRDVTRLLVPVPAKGALGLWRVDAALRQDLLAQLWRQAHPVAGQ